VQADKRKTHHQDEHKQETHGNVGRYPRVRMPFFHIFRAFRAVLMFMKLQLRRLVIGPDREKYINKGVNKGAIKKGSEPFFRQKGL
jgi:hypothetical protein